MLDLMAGRTALYIDTVSAIQAQVKAGKVRAVAVSTRKRSSSLPDVPTADEQGLKGYDANTNGGFLAPAGTSAAIVSKLHIETVRTLALPDVRAKLTDLGLEVVTSSPDGLAALIKSEIPKWAKVIKDSDIKPD